MGRGVPLAGIGDFRHAVNYVDISILDGAPRGREAPLGLELHAEADAVSVDVRSDPAIWREGDVFPLAAQEHTRQQRDTHTEPGQLTESLIKEVQITYEGAVAHLNIKALTSAELAGLSRPMLGDVNVVSAPVVARERGLAVEEITREVEGDDH